MCLALQKMKIHSNFDKLLLGMTCWLYLEAGLLSRFQNARIKRFYWHFNNLKMALLLIRIKTWKNHLKCKFHSKCHFVNILQYFCSWGREQNNGTKKFLVQSNLHIYRLVEYMTASPLCNSNNKYFSKSFKSIAGLEGVRKILNFFPMKCKKKEGAP